MVVGWYTVVGWNAVHGWNMVRGWNMVLGWGARFNRVGCLSGDWFMFGSCFGINPCKLCASELGEVRQGFNVCKLSLA